MGISKVWKWGLGGLPGEHAALKSVFGRSYAGWTRLQQLSMRESSSPKLRFRRQDPFPTALTPFFSSTPCGIPLLSDGPSVPLFSPLDRFYASSENPSFLLLTFGLTPAYGTSFSIARHLSSYSSWFIPYTHCQCLHQAFLRSA